MNTRSRRALSPVVASIILIAVTVAVSIAVAAWMGALTFNFTATEQGQITNLQFATANPQNLTITFKNLGTSPVTINEVWINNNQQLDTNLYWNASASANMPYTIPGNSYATCVVQSPVPVLVQGAQYEAKLVSSKGNTFIRSATAPV